MWKCEDCDKEFKIEDKYQSHLKNSKNCKKYKYVLFNCKKCHYKTKNITNIIKHTENCKLNIIKKDYEKLYKIMNIENQLLKSIIKNNLQINLDNIIQYNENSFDIFENDFTIKIYDSKNNVKIINENSKIELVKEKKEVFRKPKYIETREEPTKEEKKLIIENIDKENNYNSNVSENFKELFAKIKENRNYNKYVTKIKKKRLFETNKLCLDKYIELLNSQINILTNIFKEKNYTKNKISDIISKNFLLPFEHKLVKYNTYYTLELNNDDIQYLTNLSYIPKNKDYIIFNIKSLLPKIYNIFSSTFTIQDNIKSLLINKYGFNNLIYLPLKTSEKSNDYFSYYTLYKIENDIRHWTMDCRLHNLTNDIINDLYPVLIKLFREYYYLVFNDNDYRVDYDKNSPVFNTECKQLLQNLNYLCDQRKCNRFLRDFIREKCKYTPTNKDKKNIQSDDLLLQRKYKKPYKHDLNILSLIEKLFDNIKPKDIMKFYENNFKEYEI